MDFRPRRPGEGELSGPWRANPLDPTLRRIGADADLDDSRWHEVEVPGHWAQTADLADHDGPILYRCRFRHRRPVDEERLWLRFDGVLSGAEVWLDGIYVGDLTSYFAPHRFDVTEQLDRSEDHLLAVEVSCPDEGESRAKTSLTGALQSGPLAPGGNPGGIWRPVGVDSTGQVAIRHSRLLCTGANDEVGELTVRLVLDAAARTEIRIDTSIVGPDGRSAGGGAQQHELASGENRIEWTVPIDRPELWWPAAIGPQPQYDVAVAVRLGDGELTDRRDWRTGIRRIDVNDFQWRVNGERIFAKGIVYGPPGRFLSSIPDSLIADDMQAVRSAGLDLVRVYAHIGPDELYRQADRLGLLVWQDLPLLGGYSSKVRSAAKSLARAAVDRLGHHPSVGLWCGHCEPHGRPLVDPFGTESSAAERSPGSAVGQWVGRHLLPSWNRSVLDPVIGRELRNADRTRTTIARSGGLPRPSDPTGSDSQLWLGWHIGRPEDLPDLLRRWPRLGAFLGGIGSQSVAVEDWDRAAPRWPSAERAAFARYVPRSAYGDGRSWAAATRAYQADVVRAQIETLRRLKYRPTGGFCIVALVDAEPGGGFGVLDVDRQPKPALDVLVDACRPVVVVADRPPPLVVPGQSVSLAIHVVSDLREQLGPVRVSARAHSGEGTGAGSGPGGGRSAWSSQATWEGDVPADSCCLVGTLEFDAPSTHGPVIIDLELQSSERIATNRYRTVVIPSSEAIDQRRRARR